MVAYRLEINHPWGDGTLVGGFFLIATNLILAIAIYILLRIGKWSTAGVLTFLLLSSSFYHACRAGFVCLVRFRHAQVLDHLAVFTALLWIASECIVKNAWFPPAQLRRNPAIVMEATVLIFALQLFPVYLFNLENPESVWAVVFGFGMPVTLVILASAVTGEPVFYNTCLGISGVVLFAIAVGFYHFCPMQYYEWAHSVWHVLSMLAIPLVALACDRRWVEERRLREEEKGRRRKETGSDP